MTQLSLNAVALSDGLPRVVFLHGLARRWQTFHSLMATLPRSWGLTGLDHRGHGCSDRGPTYLVRDYLEDALAFLRQYRKPVVLYGHSLGALVASLAAAVAPERVQAVIMEDPASPSFLNQIAGTSYGTTFQAFQKLAGPNCGSVAEVAKRLAEVELGEVGGRRLTLGDVRDAVSLRFTARCLQDADPAIFTPVLQGNWLERLDWFAEVARIKCPVLLLHGDVAAGGMLPQDDAATLKQTVPDITVHHLAGSGHVLHWLDHQVVGRSVTAFIESL